MKEDENHELVAESLEEGLLEKPNVSSEQMKPTNGRSRFLFWVMINTLATIAIVSHSNFTHINPSS